MNVIYILLIFLGGEMGICVQICMFNFQSQVLMDQINFFKLKGDICHKSVGVFFVLFCLLRFIYLYEVDSFSLPSKPAEQTVNKGKNILSELLYTMK